MLLENLGPKAILGARDPGAALSALVATAMIRGQLVQYVYAYIYIYIYTFMYM